MDASPTANRETSDITSRDWDHREAQKKNARDNLIHAGEFTKIENKAALDIIRGWIPEANRQSDEIIKAADEVWALQTLWEHFTSELNSDATTRTRESRAVAAELKARAERAQARLSQVLGDDDEADGQKRMDALTDQTVQEVLQKLGL